MILCSFFGLGLLLYSKIFVKHKPKYAFNVCNNLVGIMIKILNPQHKFEFCHHNLKYFLAPLTWSVELIKSGLRGVRRRPSTIA